jgi:putative redox protein
MKVIGEISKKSPIEYIAIHVIYEFKGSPENKEAALNAVTDSQEKYCGVSSMLKKALPVTWEVKYNGELIFSNKKEAVAELN